MLEVDAVQEYVGALETTAEDPDIMKVLAEISKRLKEVHRELSRIPEEIIPPF